MDENLIQACAKLTTHEFLLEVLYANWLAHMPQQDADEIHAEFLRLSKSAWILPDADQKAAHLIGLTIMTDAATMTERFWEKVRRMEASIREGLSQASNHQPH
jgi:hypothetical protein